MATVDIRAVRKSFPGTPAEVIKGIDCAIADGELMVMLGPSGCGKSTLLRMVAGLERISRGEIAIAGRVVNELEPKDRNIAMVFQNYALYPHMSVYANMSYGLRIQRLERAEIDRRVRAAAAILELEPFLERKPRALSGGQRQRVAMGRAIVREPDVFLFDEPLSNLDAKLRTQMRVEIKRLQQRLATTSLYVTHDQVEAMTLADRLMVMRDGVAEQIGTPMDVYRNPATVFVGGFIGSPAMNFLEGRIDGQGRVALPGGLTLPVPGAGAREAGQPVTLGLRPEHLVPDGPATAPRLTLTVELAEALGADTLLHGRLAGSEAWLIARVGGSLPARPGDDLPLALADDACHLFDPETGRRLSGLTKPAASAYGASAGSGAG